MRYTTTVAETGTKTTGIPVPDEVVDQLGGGKRAPVVVTVNGYTYRSSLAAVDGRPMISLSAAHREASGLRGGQQVEVDLELDTAPRELSVPAELQAALDADADARRTWDGLSYSNRSWHVLQVEGAKSDETRQRRIAKSVEALRAGRPR